jgi:NTP pyrophosphatase (non-canonical NTP hydrolase)
MNLEDMILQCTNDSNRWFPNPITHTVENQVLCLAGEVGEVANIAKKVVRGSMSIGEAIAGVGLKEPLPMEVIDCLVYLCNIMGLKEFQDVDWEDLWNKKRTYNEMRFGNGVVSG